MARKSGSYIVPGTLEIQADAPADARLQVATLADLTASGSFPYKYVGMIVSVASEQKAYMLTGADPTVSANWKDISSGGTIDSLNDISDVSVSSEQAGDALVYDGTNSQWTNQQVVLASEKGAASGVAELDSNGKVPSSQLPSYVDDVIEGYLHEGHFYEDDQYTTEITGESGKIYLDLETNLSYRWSGSAFVAISSDLALGETESTAYRGDRGKAAYDHSQATSGNPHNVSATDVGLGNVDNTSDLDKPISTATQTALDAKADTSSLATVATTGDYSDLSNTPSIPDILQYATMPTADSTTEGNIVQYIGATTQDYTNGYFYKCVEDNGTYSWEQMDVQPSGGSGDAELESAVTSNLAVGAIASGTTLAQGTTFTQFVQKLLITEIAPTIGFTISKSGNVAYGGSYTETLTVNVTNMGTAKKIASIEWYEGSTLKKTDTIDSTTTGSWTYTMDTATTNTTTFKAIVKYVKSNDANDQQTKTASINFYYNKFYGGVTDLNPTEATVEALTSALATGKGGTYSFTVSAGRICYAYPKSLGALTSIKDGNGFSLFDSFTRTEQSYTQNGTSVDYYRYVLTDATTVSNYSVAFA